MILSQQGQSRIPVLLQVHEAPYIEDNPHALIFEYQVHEHGLICDSTAKKHKGCFGTQRLHLSKHVGVPFKDLGTLIGFQILPVEPGNYKEYKIHMIFLDSHWCPYCFRKIEDPPFEQSSSYYKPQMAYHAVRQLDPPGSVPPIAYEDCSGCFGQYRYCNGYFTPKDMDASNVSKKCNRRIQQDKEHDSTIATECVLENMDDKEDFMPALSQGKTIPGTYKKYYYLPTHYLNGQNSFEYCYERAKVEHMSIVARIKAGNPFIIESPTNISIAAYRANRLTLNYSDNSNSANEQLGTINEGNVDNEDSEGPPPPSTANLFNDSDNDLVSTPPLPNLPCP